MPTQPPVVTAAFEFQQQLQAANAATIREMAARWVSVEVALRSNIKLLADELAELAADGKPIPPEQLYTMQRYQSLLAQIQLELVSYTSWAGGEIAAEAEEAREEGASNAARLVRLVSSVGGSFDRLGVSAAQKVVGLAQFGKPLGEVLARSFPAAVDGLTNLLVQGTALGWSPRKTADLAVRNGLAQGLNHILLVARDQQIRNYRESSRDFYRSSGVVYGYKRLAAKNSRTCLACLALDGTIYDTANVMHLHPQCRCSMIPLVIDRPIPEWQSGKDWFEKQNKATQRKMMGAGAFELWDKGKVEFGRFATLGNHPVWGDSSRVTSLRSLKTGGGGIGAAGVNDVEELAKLFKINQST